MRFRDHHAASGPAQPAADIAAVAQAVATATRKRPASGSGTTPGRRDSRPPADGSFSASVFELPSCHAKAHRRRSTVDNEFDAVRQRPESRRGRGTDSPSRSTLDLSRFGRSVITIAIEASNWPHPNATRTGATSAEPGGRLRSSLRAVDGRPSRWWTSGSRRHVARPRSAARRLEQADFDAGKTGSSAVELRRRRRRAVETWSDTCRASCGHRSAGRSPRRAGLRRPADHRAGPPEPRAGRTPSARQRATTLQALELTNGATLDRAADTRREEWLMRQREGRSSGPDRYAGSYRTAPRARADRRRSCRRERIRRRASRAKEGVEDLLWAIVMLPEFQLIH